jgi:arylsulfatase A-like enzyme
MIGIWDSITILSRYAPNPFDLQDALALTLYALAIYGALGFFSVLIFGFIIAAAITEIRPNLSNIWFTGLVMGISAMLIVDILVDMDRDLVDLFERFMISLVSGLVIGYVSSRLLQYRNASINLAPICFSLVFWISSLMFLGLWANDVWLSEGPWTTKGFLMIIILLVVVSLAATAIYRLLVFIPQRINTRSITWAGRIFASIVIVVCIAVSVQEPLDFDSNPDILAQSHSSNGNESSPQQSITLERPNIILIVMDMVRADHLSCYGYQHNTTPHIDNIASEGVLFENAFSAAPWTVPSHASLFTSMLTCQHDTHGSHPWLDDQFNTIAEVLSENGYITLGYSNNPLVSPSYNLAQGFDTFEFTQIGKRKLGLHGYLRIRRWLGMGNQVIIDGVGYGLIEDDGAESTNKTVKDWISIASQHENPFFLFINYMEAHEPLHPPEPYAMRFMPKGFGWDDVDRGLLRYPEYLTGVVPHDDDAFAIRRALYDAEISYLDVRIGELFEYLRESNVLDETLLIIASDHGENFGDHGLMDHMFCVYDTLTHVPLIMRYPGVFEGGQTVEDLIRLIDIFPTILDISAINSYDIEKMSGNSLLKETKEPELRFAISQDRIWLGALKNLHIANQDFDSSIFQRELESIRTEQYKYIWGSDGREELYDIRIDPQELDNLIESEPEVANELRSLLLENVSSCKTSLPADFGQ